MIEPPRTYHPVILYVGAILGLASGCDIGNEYVEPPPPTVTVSTPEQRSVLEYLEFTGTTEAVATVEIRARVKGFLKAVYFEESDFVEAGAPLYLIDPAEYLADVEAAEARVAVAVAQLELAEATVGRMQEAAKTNAVSAMDVDEAVATRDSAQAAIRAREADLQRAKLDLSYTEINAPMAGRVGRNLVDAGNLVGASENTLLTTIVQLDPMYAYFDISERNLLALMAETADSRDVDYDQRLARLRQTPLELGIASEEGYPHAGHMHWADQGVDPGTGTLLVRGVFPNPRPIVLLPGLFARVRTPNRSIENALLVPERALGADQGGRYLLVVDDQDIVQQRRVVVGQPVEGGLRVIESGLTADDRVVIDGILRARPGGKVNPQPAEAAPQPAAAPAAGN